MKLTGLLLLVAGLATAYPSFQDVLSLKNSVLLEDPQFAHDYQVAANSEFEGFEATWKLLLEQLLMLELDNYVQKAKTKIAELKKESQKESPKISDSFSIFANEPIENIDTPEYEVLSLGDYQLRTKKSGIDSLHLDHVKLYVGYMDFKEEDKHFFYWFFESRNDPKTDPIVLWLNGGPGCASDTGLFFELGPSSIGPELKPIYNPFSWNSNASVIFLDQPVGTGYSYAGNEDVGSTVSASKDVYVFLELFFKKFPQFLQNKFHIAGESYAGHYIPGIASEIIHHPERSFEISSLLIGNGAVDIFYQTTFDKKMICDGDLDLLSPQNCTQMEENLLQCLTFENLCLVTESILACTPAAYFCQKAYGPIDSLKLNPYDLRRPCEDDFLCYNDLNYIADYMNADPIKEAVGANTNLTFQSCSNDVGSRFRKTHDGQKPFDHYIAEVLDYGIPTLLYAGDKDFVCHWLGFNAVSNLVKFKHQEDYSNTQFAPWITSSGEEKGQVRGYGGLTFLKVYDAGHMVPHDQPEVALELLNTWLSGDYYFGY